MNTLKSEFYKFKKSTLVRNTIALSALFATLTPIVFYFSIINDSDATAQELASTAIDLFTTNYSVPFVQVLAAIFTSIFVSSEFTYGTIKNYISKGVKKTDLFFSKLFISLIGVSIIFAVYNSVLFAVGTVLLGFDTALTAQVIGGTIITWLLFMAYTALFVSVSMMVRNSGSAIGINIGIVTFGAIVLKIVEILFEQLKMTPPANLWIESAISSVTTFPHEANTLMLGSVTAVVYFILALICGVVLFKKSDIK